MPGTYAFNLKEGSRSEILADYLFSNWGTVTPVRRQDDIGVDLYCTLADRIGRLGVVREYFTVQVKSSIAPWELKDPDSVRWLIKYPTPLFLACVEKKKGSVSVYQLMPRFRVSALGELPSRLELTPAEADVGELGKFVGWKSGERISLSAPIIHATIGDLIDDEKMQVLHDVFSKWVEFDHENCDLVRQGLPMYRMPDSYRTNQLPHAQVEFTPLTLDPNLLERGILRLAESAECLGGQLFHWGDRSGALRAALLVRHIFKIFPDAFKDQPRWATMSGAITRVLELLNEAVRDRQGPNYLYRGIDEVGKALESDPAVATFLASK
jgi:hypothetical protein